MDEQIITAQMSFIHLIWVDMFGQVLMPCYMSEGWVLLKFHGDLYRETTSKWISINSTDGKESLQHMLIWATYGPMGTESETARPLGETASGDDEVVTWMIKRKNQSLQQSWVVRHWVLNLLYHVCPSGFVKWQFAAKIWLKLVSILFKWSIVLFWTNCPEGHPETPENLILRHQAE